jgi:thiamine-phosphate pyrophosphorylase
MARCYSAKMPLCHPLPAIWLISDARNDAVLERALARMPRGGGFVFRHYHLAPKERRARFDALARVARARGHCVILGSDAREARRWGADGCYGGPGADLATAHNLRELGRVRGAAVLLSPVFATRSHPGAPCLGPVRFPVLALGGMSGARARALRWGRWAAIDGLSPA